MNGLELIKSTSMKCQQSDSHGRIGKSAADNPKSNLFVASSIVSSKLRNLKNQKHFRRN